MSMKKTVATRGEEEKIAAYQAVADRSADQSTEEKAPAPSAPEPDGKTATDAGAATEVDAGEAPTLTEQLAAKTREASEAYDRMLRVSAEFENYRKRSSREMEDFRKYANEALLRDLLPVVDNLERALEVPVDGQVNDPLRQGIELTLKEVQKVLERFVVRPIDAQGQPFDPAFHEAMMQEENSTVPENTVIRQFQKGYTIHDRLLRPAMVIVAKAAVKGMDGSTAADTAADTTEAQS